MSGDTANTVISVIAETTSKSADEITLESELDELDIASLELTEIVMELEDRYDVSVDLNTAEAWSSLSTVADVVTLVDKLLAEKSVAT